MCNGDDETNVAQLALTTRRPLLYYALIVQLIIAMLLAFGIARRAGGQERQTLLQWSYGTSFGGGPDLYKPLVSDRPDFTESSVTVGRGVAQLEMGYTFTQDEFGGVTTRTHTFPEALLRTGILAEWLELRTEWSGAVERSDFGNVANTEVGSEDLTVGVKIALTPQEAILPETAIILQMSLPTGAAAFTSHEVLPSVDYLYSWEIHDDWSVSASTELGLATDDVTSDIYSQFSQSISLGHEWSKRIHSFCEWYVLAPVSADTNRPENYLDGGFSALISNDAQWDIRAGVGLNSAADNFFAGTGLSIRYW